MTNKTKEINQITFNLYDIVKEVIKSTNPKEYIKKIKDRTYVYGYYLIEKENLLKILEKSKILINKIKNNIITGFDVDGNLYFRAKDNCKLLNYSDTKQTINQIDDNFKIEFSSIPRGGVCYTPHVE